ncbi:MAG TPA: DUF2924 domain-containing protein [Pirellula sp.]|nr:DUF2924 domain-containing protein [Pirellula sp.]
MKSTKSAAALQRELCNLELMKAVQLKKRYQQLFGEPCHSCNKTYLVRRIAWRLQSNAEGGLSERAKRRIEEQQLAEIGRISQPRMTQIMSLLLLAPDILEELLYLPEVMQGKAAIHERLLRPLTTESDWKVQRRMWKRIRKRG